MRRVRNLRGRRRPNRLYEKKYRGFDFDRIYASFVEAMLWAEEEQIAEDAGLEDYEVHDFDLSSDAEKRIKKDIEKFIKMAGEDTIENYVDMYTAGQYRRGEDQLGHNFYLTRQGHGAGFFDEDDIYSKKLDKISDRFSEIYPFIQDGKIEID